MDNWAVLIGDERLLDEEEGGMEEEKKLVVKEGPRLTVCGGGDGGKVGKACAAKRRGQKPESKPHAPLLLPFSVVAAVPLKKFVL